MVLLARGGPCAVRLRGGGPFPWGRARTGGGCVLNKAHLALFAALAAGAASWVAACGSPDCTETATCHDSGADGAPTKIVDAHPDTTGSPDAEGFDGDAGPSPGDGGAPCDPSAPDCSNPACMADFACVAQAPPRWLGPIALSDLDGGPPAPTVLECTGAYGNVAFDGHADPTSPAAPCVCTCGVAGNICTLPSISVYSNNICQGLCGTAGDAGCSSTCPGGGGPGGGQSARLSARPMSTDAGSCAAAATAQGAAPAWQWTRTARGCAATQQPGTRGCPPQQVCAPRPPSSFSPALCVWSGSSTTCTGDAGATGYPTQHTYYQNANDTRACATGSCACASPSGVTCALNSVTLYSNSTCTDGGFGPEQVSASQFTGPGGCYQSQNTISGVSPSVTMTGQCAPIGAPANSGGVAADPTTAVTVCCTQ